MTPSLERNSYARPVRGRPGKTLLSGADRAAELAQRIDDRRDALGFTTDAMVKELGLRSKSGWTKRCTYKPGHKEWTAFSVEEVETLIPILGRGEPGWPYLDEGEAIKLIAYHLGGRVPPPGPEPANPAAASSSTAKPARQEEQGGGRPARRAR